MARKQKITEDDIVLEPDTERESFIKECLMRWALIQFERDNPCRITDEHAGRLRERAEGLYDRLFG